jgi:gliding motility-associated-like protein
VVSTTYTVTASYTSGCTSTKKIKVNVDPVPSFTAGPDIGVCPGSSANVLINDKEIFFTWSPAAGLSCIVCPDPVITIDSNITYIIRGSNGYCFGYDTLNVFVTTPPVPGILADDSICYDTADTIYYTGTASPTAVFTWDFGDGKIISGSGSGPYVVSWSKTGIKKVKVTVTEAGCPPVSANMDINVRCRLVVPNAITPNGDGPNDIFYIEGLEMFPKTRILVYNRWGLLIYESDDYKNDWDGTIDGKPLSDGVYFYIIRFNDKTAQHGFLYVLKELGTGKLIKEK